MKRTSSIVRKNQLEPADVAVLWNDWRASENIAMRERLIEHYLPFVRMFAAKLFAKRHCEEFEFDDYLQYATIGLIECVDRFDPKSGAIFTTFAAKRIKGIVLDGVQRLSERQEQINCHQRLRMERSNLVGCAAKEYSYEGKVFFHLAEIAMSLALGFILDGSGLYLDVEPVQHDLYSNIELRQMRERLLALVEELPERERLLIKFNYFNHLPFDVIAQQFGFSRGRIAQLHRSALERLRKSSCNGTRFDATC